MQVAISKGGGAPRAASDDAGPEGSSAPGSTLRSLSFRTIPERPGHWTLQIRSPGAGGSAAAAPPAAVSMVVTQAELVMMRHLFNTSIVWVTGWMQSLNPGTFDPSIHTDYGTSASPRAM